MRAARSTAAAAGVSEVGVNRRLSIFSAHWADACTLLTGDACLQLADDLQKHYSRSNDAEADFCAYHIAEAAGYNPDGLFHR